MLSREFAARFSNLKHSQQDEVERQLMRATRECTVSEEDYWLLVDQRRQAQIARNHARTAADLASWQGYVQALEATEAKLKFRWEQSQDVVEQERANYQQAYRESLKWDHIRDKSQELWRRIEEGLSLKQADENAVLKFGRNAAP